MGHNSRSRDRRRTGSRRGSVRARESDRVEARAALDAALADAALTGVLAGAPDSMGIAGGSISHLVLMYPPAVLGTQPTIMIFGRGAAGESASMIVGFDGTPVLVGQPS